MQVLSLWSKELVLKEQRASAFYRCPRAALAVLPASTGGAGSVLLLRFVTLRCTSHLPSLSWGLMDFVGSCSPGPVVAVAPFSNTSGENGSVLKG